MGVEDEEATVEDVMVESEAEDEEEEENDGGGGAGGDDEKAEKESSSESDSDDDEDGEGESGRRIQQLEEAVAANAYNYEAHVELIFTLRKCGLLEKLRAAREAMSALYPLTPTMWKEWAQDEARLASRPEDVVAVEALYERAIKDYQSVSLWLDFLKFVEVYDPAVAEGKPEGVSKMRRLYEQALAAVGLHFAEGGKVWEAYRDFELAVLVILNEAGSEGKAKQVETVRSIYRRQLTVPLADLAGTLVQYKEWEEQQGNHIGDENDVLAGIPLSVSSAYKKALLMCSSRDTLEEKISKGQPGDAGLLQNYLEYITIEEATGEPARAQVLYERTISEFAISQDVWLRYTQYLETNLKVAVVLKGVYARATRNCPWVQILWKNYLLALERSHAPESDLSAVFEQSLLGGFPTSQEYLELFLTRCDGIRRRIMTLDESASKQSDVSLLHETFDRASQFMSTYYPDFVDRTLQLHGYWAHTEAHVAKDLVAARGVWENLIKSSGWMVEVWQGYISMELSLRNIKEARAIYRSCYSRRLEGNGTELMCSAWLRFEREHGSLEDYDRAVMKVAPRLAEVKSMQMQQEAKSAQPSAEHIFGHGAPDVKNKTRDPDVKGGRTNNLNLESASSKRKRGLGNDSGPKDSKALAKRPKVSGHNESTKIANEPQREGTKQNERKKATPEVSASSSRGEGNVENAPAELSRKPRSPKQYTDECTAFVRNISHEVSEDQLREFFSCVAGVKEVRLLRDRVSGQSRGLAYVEFEDEDSLVAAISKDNEELGGQSIRVARSAPKGGRGAGGGGRSSSGRIGRGGLGYHGGRQSGGRGEENAGHSVGGGRSRGGGLGLGHRRGGKVGVTGNNTFAVPRAVVRPLGWGAGQQASTGDEAPKSNDEFRKMLLSKK